MSESIIARPQTERSQLTVWLGYLGLIPFLVPLWQMIKAVHGGVGVHGASLFGVYAP